MKPKLGSCILYQRRSPPEMGNEINNKGKRKKKFYTEKHKRMNSWKQDRITVTRKFQDKVDGRAELSPRD